MRKFLSYFFTFIAGAVIVGGGAYYSVNKKAADEKEVLQGDNNTLRLQIQDLQNSQSQAAQPAPSTSDNDLVTGLVRADCGADPKVDPTKGVFTVKKLTAPFATVSFSCTTTTASSLAVLKKTGDSWAIIYKGDKAPDKATIDKYAIPKDFQS